MSEFSRIAAIHIASTGFSEDVSPLCIALSLEQEDGAIFTTEQRIEATDIPPAASVRHHLTDEDCADAPPWEFVYQDILRVLREKGVDTIVSYDPWFELRFLKDTDLVEAGVKRFLGISDLCKELFGDYLSLEQIWYGEKMYRISDAPKVYLGHGQSAAESYRRCFRELIKIREGERGSHILRSIQAERP